MKKILKKLSQRLFVIKILAWLIAKYMALVYRTTRWTYRGLDHCQPYFERQEPFICCFWHNRLLMTTFAWTSPMPFHMLISDHADGRIISQTVAHYDIQTIVGSKSKGGTAALRQIIKTLKSGGTIGITPDGPRGPRFQASEGIAMIAKLSGMDVLPVTYATRLRRVLNSWDKFILALPFGRGIIAWGQPIRFEGGDMPAFADKITVALNDLNDQADRLCGHAPLHLNFDDATSFHHRPSS